MSLEITIALGSVLTAILGYLFGIRGYDEKEEIVARKVEEAEAKVSESPDKAKPAWDLARATLELYFNRNLKQINSIFWVSIGVMLVGFSIIVIGILTAINNPGQLKSGAIAAFSGIMTEFIGATFLFLHKSAIKQAEGYSQTLERINSVGMAMQILDTISDNAEQGDLKSKTKAKIAESLISGIHGK